MTPRPYQIECVERVMGSYRRGLTRVLAAAPTGCGKSLCYAMVANEVQREDPRRILVVAHQDKLLKQGATTMRSVNREWRMGLEAASRHAHHGHNVIFAMVQSAGRADTKRLDWLKASGVSLIIVDEAHHSAAKTYLNIVEGFGGFDGKCRVLGLTATPKRLDRKALTGMRGSMFQEQVFSYTILEAINQGYLCDLVGIQVKTRSDISGLKSLRSEGPDEELARIIDNEDRTTAIIRKWQEHCSDRVTIVFSSNRAHSRHVCDAFKSIGVRAEHVDGDMPTGERDRKITAFESGHIQVLCNVDLLREGYDHKPISCVVMARPFESWAAYVQCVGRGTRICPEVGKKDCIVLDVCDVSGKHSLAALPAIIDLPADIDMQGKTIREAADIVQRASDKGIDVGQQAFTRLNDIDLAERKVDLFHPGAVPEEIARHTPNKWSRAMAGFSLFAGGKRHALVKRDQLDNWTLECTDVINDTPAKVLELKLHGSISSAIRQADSAIMQQWPESRYVTPVQATWRQKPASEAQLAALRKFRIPESDLAGLTKEVATARLDKLIAQIRSSRFAKR